MQYYFEEGASHLEAALAEAYSCGPCDYGVVREPGRAETLSLQTQLSDGVRRRDFLPALFGSATPRVAGVPAM